MTDEPGADRGTLERGAMTVIDSLLTRVAFVTRELEGDRAQPIDRARARLVTADLAMVATLVRALNEGAAGRLTQAATALRQAREDVERHPESVLR